MGLLSTPRSPDVLREERGGWPCPGAPSSVPGGTCGLSVSKGRTSFVLAPPPSSRLQTDFTSLGSQGPRLRYQPQLTPSSAVLPAPTPSPEAPPKPCLRSDLSTGPDPAPYNASKTPPGDSGPLAALAPIPCTTALRCPQDRAQPSLCTADPGSPPTPPLTSGQWVVPLGYDSGRHHACSPPSFAHTGCLTGDVSASATSPTASAGCSLLLLLASGRRGIPQAPGSPHPSHILILPLRSRQH